MAVIETNPETWHSTVVLSFIKVDGKDILHQGYISSLGNVRWEPVPSVRAGDTSLIRPYREAVAGNPNEEDGE